MTLEELKAALDAIEARPVTDVLVLADWSGELPGSRLFSVYNVTLDTETDPDGPVVHLICQQQLLAEN